MALWSGAKRLAKSAGSFHDARMIPKFRISANKVIGVFLVWLLMILSTSAQPTNQVASYDVVIVGGTPGGITAAIAAARGGRSVVLLERTPHAGGLPVNGLGATDIATHGATGGLFREFVQRNYDYYVRTYGKDSPQVKACSDGYHFEPSVAEKTFAAMLAEQPKIEVRLLRQFDALPENVILTGSRLTEIKVLNRETKTLENYRAKVFIDATYEGDFAAAAGAPYRLGREAFTDSQEPMSGQLYKQWGGPVGPGSTGFGDNAVQAYNYRVALTDSPENRFTIEKPQDYRRADYASIAEDIKLNRTTAPPEIKRSEQEWNGIGRVVNMVTLPNRKTDANNQHAAFVSTDLPEENWPWPTASWDWRDQFAQRQRDYTLGLIWFMQHDPEIPEEVRQRCQQWGLAKGEYADNGHFPRQVYVREGRRILGDFIFSAHDALPVKPGERPPIYGNSITASHYSLDSHAVRKREPGRVHLDGFFSYPTKPYTVPYGVIVPQKVDGLLIPVPASATHIGFSTLRMEPCWMALGQAAGVAASLSIGEQVEVRRVSYEKIQNELLKQKSILIYYEDTTPEHPHFAALQYFGLHGLITSWKAELDHPLTADTAKAWQYQAGIKQAIPFEAEKTTRGEFLSRLHAVITRPTRAGK